MTPLPVPLEDIRDVVGFSRAVVRRLQIKWTPDEIDEATVEGVALLYELRRVWNRTLCPSFADYCMTYLELRLIDWYRREVRQRNLAHKMPGSGTNRLVYHGRVSLEELRHDGGGIGDMDDLGEEAVVRQLVTHDSHRLGD